MSPRRVDPPVQRQADFLSISARQARNMSTKTSDLDVVSGNRNVKVKSRSTVEIQILTSYSIFDCT